MIRLLLMRHAKAAVARGGEDDFDRPLTARGHRDTARMADWIVASHLHPASVICSAARRTRETLASFLPAVADDAAIRLTRDLYEAEPADYLAAIADQGDGVLSPLLVIGHNPAIHTLALDLIADTTVRSGPIARSFPTASIAVLDFDILDWQGLTFGSGRLLDFTTPREIGAPGGASASG